jgi:hypothetical protein
MYEAECTVCKSYFEYYSAHITEFTNPCPKCGGKADRLFSTYSPKFFTPFTTRNIDPSGMPILVKSQRQLSSLCNEHKLIHHDDPKWQPKPRQAPNIHDAFGSKDLAEALRGVEGGACRQEELLAP